MSNGLSFSVIGGDERQKYMSQYLRENGFQINEYNKATPINELIKNSDNIILPLPVTKDNIKIFSSNFDIDIDDLPFEEIKSKTIFCGKVSQTLKERFEKNNITYYDYFDCEAMTVKNAVATVEGALALAIQNSKKTLFLSNILITGYGRIGKILSKSLSALGANVTVCSRKSSDKVWQSIQGYNSIDFENLKENNDFDFIFNTVPHIVFTKSELQTLSKDAVIIDLASNPGGVDLNQIKSMKLNLIKAASLPGRFSPISAGEFIAQAIIKIIKEGE